MKSLRDVYKIGKGPSSSHTMGPAKAMEIFTSENADADSYVVVLYGSLADTGKGHGTDTALKMAAGDKKCEIIFDINNRDLPHENTMDIYAVRGGKRDKKPMRVMSIGGGDFRIEGRAMHDDGAEVYPEGSFA